MFSDPGYLAATTGLKDPSDKKSVVSDRNRGIQFKVNPPKVGVLNDAMFDKFKCLSVHDGKEGKAAGDGEKKKKDGKKETGNVSEQHFKYSSPGKKATGMGSVFGLFNAIKADEVKEGKGPKSVDPHDRKPEPRNILTSPGKRGTYGFPGTTLGKGEEFTYKEADEKAEKKKKKDKLPDPGKPVSTAPFKAACKHIDFFDGHPNVPASKIYTIEEKFLPKVKKESKPKEQKPLNAAAFKPSSPAKTGILGTLSKFEYGSKEEEKKVKPKKKEEEKKVSVVWKPTATAHSLPVKSIAYNSTAINASILRHD